MTAAQQEKQFTVWIEQHFPIAIKVARSFERSPDAQPDLLQEILLQWWRSVASFPAGAESRAWLYRVSFNAALTWQRRECRRSRLIARDASFAGLAETAEYSPADANLRDTVTELYAAIHRLRPAERTLILLHLDGFSYSEIASTLGISANAVGIRLTRTREHLQTLLKVEGKYERI